MKLAEELIRYGQQLSEENNAAHDLWTWLPSYKIAQQHHGDYADVQQPSKGDVMHEAALYIASLRRTDATVTPEEREWFEKCPCGEDHRE